MARPRKTQTTSQADYTEALSQKELMDVLQFAMQVYNTDPLGFFTPNMNNQNNMRLIIETEEDEAVGFANIVNIDWKNRSAFHGIKIANIGEVLVHARVGNGMIQRRGNKKYIKSWHQMNRYMVKNGMIGNFTYARNMLAVTAFVYMPVRLKDFVYKKILRKD